MGLSDSILGPWAWTNANSLWAGVLVETLARLGVAGAVVCPGSRSTPLTIALAQHPTLTALPVLDERSAAFFGLGWARQRREPVVLVCTSGTAGANFLPAVIEAYESRIPLLILTADRPAELRDCASGQTIDQVKLYGSYALAYGELGLPEVSLAQLAYARQTITQAVARSRSGPGPVHLNIPFRDPLAPIVDPQAATALAALRDRWQDATFFGHLQPTYPSLTPATNPATNPTHQPVSQPANQPTNQPANPSTTLTAHLPAALWELWQSEPRGIIVAGPAEPRDPEAYCRAVARLADHLGWPVLAEGLSPLRNFAHLNSHLVAAYDLILRRSIEADRLAPRYVIRLGALPTSKVLRAWLTAQDPQTWLVTDSDRNLDPLHGRVVPIRAVIDQWLIPSRDRPSQTQTQTQPQTGAKSNQPGQPGQTVTPGQNQYLALWQTAEAQIQQAIGQTFQAEPFPRESKVPWLLGQSLPIGSAIFIANSMPVRDVEWFWPTNDRQIQPAFNRGANGIDGSLSTALGMAYGVAQGHANQGHANQAQTSQAQTSFMLTGDLALLHDTNGFLLYHALGDRWQGSLTILLINNNGGGIFEMLPVSKFEPPFEAFFATPQDIDFQELARTYGVEYKCLDSWLDLVAEIEALPQPGVRLLEIQTDRREEAQWRQTIFGQ